MKTANVRVRPRAKYLLCSSALAGVLAISACGHLPNQGVGQVSVARGTAVLMLVPQVTAGGYRAQAITSNYKKSDINHLLIKVFELQGNAEIPVVDEAGNQVQIDLLNSELDSPLTFNNLNYDTTYRIRCYAYKSPGSSDTDLISTTDSSSYTDVMIGTNPYPIVSSIRVKLIDVVFSGQVSTNIVVADGNILQNGAVTVKRESFLYMVSTLVGSSAGNTDGVSTNAMFNAPLAAAIDAAGFVYVADAGNSLIRKIAPDGSVITLAGGTRGSEDGVGSNASFSHPSGIAVSPSGTVFVTDTANNTIRKIAPNGTVTTLAGNPMGGYQDGMGVSALFYRPTGICLDSAGNLYIADSGNNCIRKVTQQGLVTTIAGSTQAGFRDGMGVNAQFNKPFGVTVDNHNTLYISDSENHAIRKVVYGQVTTLAGNGDFGDNDGVGPQARFDGPLGIAMNATGFLYVADTNNNYIRKISPNGTVSTIAGSGYEGTLDGNGDDAEFSSPSGIAIKVGGPILVVDSHNHRIRHVYIK